MGRRAKNAMQLVAPVSSKKQMLDKAGVCQFIAGISIDTLDKIRSNMELRFPQPLQILSNMPLWTVDQIERWAARNEKLVESLST